MSYVVYWCEYLRDGVEKGANVKKTLDEALELITKLKSGFGGDTLEIHLFELGKEIPLQFEDVFEEQPPLKKGVRVTIKNKI